MLRTYQRVLSLPGAPLFSASGLVARLPISMVSLGIVLLVSTRTGSYGLAGTVSAAFLAANALTSVPQARLVDRLGQGRVLPAVTLLFAAGLAATMAAVETGAPAPVPHLCAAVAGAAMAPVGSCVRARWSFVVHDRGDLETAFALEAVADEVVFIVGPALVTVLATLVHPLAGLAAAGIAALLGTAVLVSQRRTEPPPGGHEARGDDFPMPWGVLGPLAACGFTMGILLGGAEVATVALCDELGDKPLSGLMLGLWAAGSLLAGVATGAVRHASSHATRFRWGLLAMSLLMVPLTFVDGFVALGLLLFLSGFAVAPTLVACIAWIEDAVPAARFTEGTALFITGISAGTAPGAILVGRVVDTASASASYWVPVAAGLLGTVVAFATARLRRARPSPSGSSA